MSKVTKAEKWFGKKKKDLTQEELKEFNKLVARERRSLPNVKEYRKKYQEKYRKEHKNEINNAIKNWKQNNIEKTKSYRFAKFNREIDNLKIQLDQQKARIEELEGQFAYECECNKQFVQLQKMWNELKEWVSFTQPKNINDEFLSGACCAYSNIIDKMQELEVEDEN